MGAMDYTPGAMLSMQPNVYCSQRPVSYTHLDVYKRQDPFRSYSDMFTGETVPQTNPEYIWGRMSGNIADITRHSFNGDILGGFNGMCVPQKVIDKYKMADGRSIQNSSSEYQMCIRDRLYMPPVSFFRVRNSPRLYCSPKMDSLSK